LLLFGNSFRALAMKAQPPDKSQPKLAAIRERVRAQPERCSWKQPNAGQRRLSMRRTGRRACLHSQSTCLHWKAAS